MNAADAIAELRAQAQETESALEAYLEGIKLTNEKPSAEISLVIGTLFKQQIIIIL